LEGAPVSQGQGQRHPILGQPVGAFPYSQQDPFPEDKEKDDEEEEEEEEHVICNQQVFHIGEGIILDDIYHPNIKCPKENFCLEELVFFIMLSILQIEVKPGGFPCVLSFIIAMPVP